MYKICNEEKHKIEVFNNLNQNDCIFRQPGYIDGHAYHLYVIECKRRKELHKYLRDHNIYAQIHYIPVTLMPYYREIGWKIGDMPVAESYYNQCLSLPIYPALSGNEFAYVVDKIFEFFRI